MSVVYSTDAGLITIMNRKDSFGSVPTMLVDSRPIRLKRMGRDASYLRQTPIEESNDPLDKNGRGDLRRPAERGVHEGHRFQHPDDRDTGQIRQFRPFHVQLRADGPPQEEADTPISRAARRDHPVNRRR